MNGKKLALLTITTIAIATNFVAAAKPVPGNFTPPERDEIDNIWDYAVYMAEPVEYEYVVMRVGEDGVREERDRYDNPDSAGDSAFFSNRVQVEYHYYVVEEALPQDWVFFSRSDTRAEAYMDADFVEDMGFDSDVREVYQIRRTSRIRSR